MEYININNTKIAIYRKKYPGSDNLPIVLIHGYTGSALHHFSYEIENYSRIFQTEVLSYDHRGHGNSEPGENWQNLPFNIHYLDMEEIMNYFKYEKIILIGASFGGLLANQFTIDHPEIVQKLVIISSTAESSTGMTGALIYLKDMLQKYIDMKDITKFHPNERKFISVLLKIHHQYDPPFNKLKFLKNSVENFIKFTANWTLLEELKKINCPVLIIHGDIDYVELKNAIKMSKNYQNLYKLEVLHNFGHLPQRKDPLLVERIIGDFITNTDR